MPLLQERQTLNLQRSVFFTLFFSPSLGVLFADSSIAFPLPAQKNSRRLQAVKDEISPHSLSSPPKTLLLAQVE